MKAVRTVLGDISPDTLGVCDAHDHLFLRMSAFLGQELDDPAAAHAELASYRELGGGALAQWTPFGMGRMAAALPEVSRSAGAHVIAATGLHQAAQYDPKLLDRLRAGGLGAFFTAELTEGMLAGDDPDGPRVAAKAGMIKVAGVFHALDAHTREVWRPRPRPTTPRARRSASTTRWVRRRWTYSRCCTASWASP